MKTPPLLMAAAILFWGWQTGLWAVAIPFAAVLEAGRWLHARWDFSDTDFNRIWNLCAILFLGVVVVGFFTSDGSVIPSFSLDVNSPATRSEPLTRSGRAVFLLFEWLPVIFFPIIVAQAYSTREKIPLTSISWLVRRRFARARQIAPVPEPVFNASYCYLSICLIAASTAPASGRTANAFYWGLAAVVVWALWSQRNRRFSIPLWGGLLGIAVFCGYTGQQGMIQLQQLVERLDSAILGRFGTAPDNTARAIRTSLGAIGRLKLSGRIVLRLQVTNGSPPQLLREASYNTCRYTSWLIDNDDFAFFAPDAGHIWDLLPRAGNSPAAVRIYQYLKDGQGILPVPLGTSQLREFPAYSLETNNFGVIRATGPGLVNYVARYGSARSIDSSPRAQDLNVPPSENAAVSLISDSLGLPALAAANPLKALETTLVYFQTNFTYSTYQSRQEPSFPPRTPLGRFLLDTHSGHCEYFATATVLLLRKAGIPARYAIGYAVHEGSGQNYVVRQRDGHAWCLAYYNGGWHDFDTTPASWQAIESQRATFWQSISDFFSGLWFEFSKWRWGESDKRKYIAWLLIPLLVIMALRLVIQKQWVRLQGEKRTGLARQFPGFDSEFYLILKRLEEQGLTRAPGESLLAWLQRIQPRFCNSGPLTKLLHLHYRLRFDPLGLSEEERAALKAETREWLTFTENTSE